MTNLIKISISGDSMSPLFLDGDILNVDSSAYEDKEVLAGDVIVFNHPFIKDFIMIKKVKEIIDSRYFVIGINESKSTDSRHFGTIKKESIIGKVVF